MNRVLLASIFILLLLNTVSAQNAFRGVVVEDSMSKSPIYQASVQVRENGNVVATLTTYFDGSFTHPTQKGKVYEFTASNPGSKDVTLIVTTDKRGAPVPLSAYFIMRKDGLRLVGMVKDINTNMPIDKADVILKDVQTREETRFTTNLDGRYNLKLKFETNYRISIDKRSAGIANRYEDTVFFVSTVGFNQALDYELDIALRKAQQITNRTTYAPSPSKPASKPIIEVKANQESPQIAVEVKPETRTPSAKETPKAPEQKPIIKEEKALVKQHTDTVKSAPQGRDYSSIDMPDKAVKTKKEKQKKDKPEKKKNEAKEVERLARELEKQKKNDAPKAVKANVEKPIAKEVKADKASEKKPTEKKLDKPQQVKQEQQVVSTAKPEAQAAPKAVLEQENIKEKLEQKVVEQTKETTAPKSAAKVTPASIIYFAKNAAYITDFSKGKLNVVIEQLKANTKAKIVLNCHAGKEENAPDDLCNKRLASVKSHFAANGISADRISSINNGNRLPFNDCYEKGGCSEQLLILNRRMEIQIKE